MTATRKTQKKKNNNGKEAHANGDYRCVTIYDSKWFLCQGLLYKVFIKGNNGFDAEREVLNSVVFVG